MKKGIGKAKKRHAEKAKKRKAVTDALGSGLRANYVKANIDKLVDEMNSGMKVPMPRDFVTAALATIAASFGQKVTLEVEGEEPVVLTPEDFAAMGAYVRSSVETMAKTGKPRLYDGSFTLDPKKVAAAFDKAGRDTLENAEQLVAEKTRRDRKR